MIKGFFLGLGLGLAFTASPALRAQPTAIPALAPTRNPAEARLGLTDLFGRGRNERLMRSSVLEDRLRGTELTAAEGTSDALARLVRCKDDSSCASSDSRVLLSVVRGLAAWAKRPTALAALAAIARASTASLSTRHSTGSAGALTDDDERVDLARREAALGLAASGSPDARNALLDIVRDGGVGLGAASDGLQAYPPEPPTTFLDKPSLAELDLVLAVADLRSVDAVREATRSSDGGVRAAALVTLGALGDPRALETARAWSHDPEARARVASAEVLVRMGARDAASAVEQLVVDDQTTKAGLRLAQSVQGAGLTKALAARGLASADLSLRLAAVSALSKQTVPLALDALKAWLADPVLGGASADGLAHSPNAGAVGAIEEAGAREATRRLAARAYFVRRSLRGDRSAYLDALLASLAHSSDARDRAVAMQARVALGEIPVDTAWQDGDARVRRAAALGAMARLDDSTAARLVSRMLVEPDRITRIVLSGALPLAGGTVLPSRSDLLQRVDAGEADAPMAAFAFGRSEDGGADDALSALLASRDSVIRAHVLRGLATSGAAATTARIALAYRWETVGLVRRAAIDALAARGLREAPKLRRDTLDLAARLDPDPGVRATARQALAGKARLRPRQQHEIAWLTLAPAEGAEVPRDVTGFVMTEQGRAVPIAFDDDGFALVPGLPPGEANLRLAARLPPYSPETP